MTENATVCELRTRVEELEFLRKRVAELEGENARLKAELETIADDLEWLNCMFEIVQEYCME